MAPAAKLDLRGELPWAAEIMPCGKTGDGERAGAEISRQRPMQRLGDSGFDLVLDGDVEARGALILRDQIMLERIGNIPPHCQQVW